MRKDNYEQMRDQMRPRFLTFDQREMIQKFDLDHDTQYLYNLDIWTKAVIHTLKTFHIPKSLDTIKKGLKDINIINKYGFDHTPNFYNKKKIQRKL